MPQPTEDQWLAGDDQLPRPATFDPWSLVTRRVLVPTVVVATSVVALLGAVGVFGSDVPRMPAPIFTTPASAPQPSARTTKKTVAAHQATGPPTTTLKPGDTGPQVKALQRELASLGFPVGAIDGYYGPAVTKAVTDFQRAHRLTPDGIVGPPTLLALAP